MSIITKLALTLLVGAFIFGAGWYTRGREIQVVQGPPVVRTETQTVVQEKVVTKVVKEEVKAKDGTTKTTTTTETVADTEKKKDREQPQSVGAVSAPRANWSLGLTWTPRLDVDVYKPTGAEFGRRIVGDLWGTVAVDWRSHSATVGLRVEF